MGAMQIGFPGEIEVAANSFRSWANRVSTGGSTDVIHFEDGQRADFSGFWWEGRLFVSEPLIATQFDLLEGLQLERRKKVAARTASSPTVNAIGVQERFFQLKPNNSDQVGWRVDASYSSLQKVGNVAVLWGSHSLEPDAAAGELESARLFNMVEHATPRPLYTVPTQQGMCLPYVFIPDEDASPGRSIAMTYRLKEHPDITILLEDSRAVGVANGQNPESFTAEARTDFFWGARYSDARNPDVLWRSRHRLFAGYKSASTFVELTRRDGAQDYGYLVTVRGDPDAQVDTPDLMFYVIREAKNATAKGIEPVRKDDFLKMAEAIASTVKRRSTQVEAISLSASAPR